MGLQLPWRVVFSTSPPGKRFRVLTCNAHGRKPDRAVLERLLAEADPDVVVMQELPRGAVDHVFSEQWQVNRTSGSGLFIASRYPIRQKVLLGSNSMKAPGLLMRYELETPAGVVVVFSLHFASPREGLSEATGSPQTGFKEVAENSELRWEQSEELVRQVDEATEPVLVMGDFNTPPESAIFRRVLSRYTDAFTAAGWGWGFTFFAKRTTVRIDHIVMGPGWHCERCWVGPFIGSPHHPVLADLILAHPQP